MSGDKSTSWGNTQTNDSAQDAAKYMYLAGGDMYKCMELMDAVNDFDK